MKPAIDPLWVTDIEAAKVLQNSLREKVIRENQLGRVERIAGVDVAFAENRTITKAAVVILSYPDLTILEPTFRRLVNKVNNIFGKRNPGKKEYVDVQGLS